MAAKKRELEGKEKETSNKKLTGRELFMQDKTLNDSDLTFDEGKLFSFDIKSCLSVYLGVRKPIKYVKIQSNVFR